MANGITHIRSLEQISTRYTVFEENQVLTHDQLNSLANFSDDQTRLTRTRLLGVGIVCGLHLSNQGNFLKVTKGVGVTTDGDLLHFGKDTLFDRFKPYAHTNLSYTPFFYVGDTPITLHELVEQGVEDSLATPLEQFSLQTDRELGNQVAVLFMESVIHDPDICLATDCDNLGMDCVHTPRLLLVDLADVGLLETTPATPDAAFHQLNEVVVSRPLISSSIGSLAQLKDVYLTACEAIVEALAGKSGELSKLYPLCSTFLADIFPSDPFETWRARLLEITTGFASNAQGIQYYYDFLKDVVETYHQFRDLLFGDTTWCYPDAALFPKHLLLGRLVSGTDPNEHRTGFYPSPAVSKTADQLEHARFLALKLDALIQSFAIPAPSRTAVIRITPSLFEDRPLEERAIPYYYPVNTRTPIHQHWNYRLHQRGMDLSNYSYHAASYQTQRGAANLNPLAAQIGKFSFFRIEGHLGTNVSTVISFIEDEIKAKNLPFTVLSVFLGTDRTKVVKKPGIRYTDLHRLHHMVRQDVSYQLGEVAQFSGTFKAQVDQAVRDAIVTDTRSDGVPVTETARSKNDTINTKAASASTKLNLGYSGYIQDPSWMSDVGDLITASGEFKADLGKVVKTEFTTPFDAIIGDSKIYWLGWLDEIIKKREEGEDDKLLFERFLPLHPSIEHFGGVTRGGTFVLVYDTDQNVVADFMLPDLCCETSEEEPEEAPLSRPAQLKNAWVVENGVKVLSSRDKFFEDNSAVLSAGLRTEFTTALTAQAAQVDFLKTYLTQDVSGLTNTILELTKTVAAGTTQSVSASISAESEKALASISLQLKDTTSLPTTETPGRLDTTGLSTEKQGKSVGSTVRASRGKSVKEGPSETS